MILVLTAWFWREPMYWAFLVAAFAVAIGLHLLWRHKTKEWTEPWGGWNDVETANRE